jgi:hypothetical protein
MVSSFGPCPACGKLTNADGDELDHKKQPGPATATKLGQYPRGHQYHCFHQHRCRSVPDILDEIVEHRNAIAHGRERAEASERAEEVFQIRLTSAEKAAWREAAERADVPLAPFPAQPRPDILMASCVNSSKAGDGRRDASRW